MPSRRLKALGKFALVVWLAFVLYASLTPVPKSVGKISSVLEVAAHLIFYLVMAVLVLYITKKPSRYVLIVAILCSLLGGVIEIAQGYVGRTPDLYDGGVNTLGAFLGAYGYYFIYRYRRRKHYTTS